MNPQHHLPINLDTFGFVEREKSVNGKNLPNQCGRDFFYYCLNYYFPLQFNPTHQNPTEIKKQGVFGWSGVPIWLIWTGLSFKKVPKLFKKLGLSITINNIKVTNYFKFLVGLLPLRSPKDFDRSVKEIERSIDRNVVAGIDISMNLGGLVDHIMFVYGYDEENLYVFDTHQVYGLKYEKMTPVGDNRFIMKLPKSIARKRWTIFNRVWIVEKNNI